MSDTNKKKSHVGSVLVILLTIAVTGMWIFALYSDYHIETGEYTYPSAAGIDNIQINYYGNASVVFYIEDLDDSDFLYKAQWRQFYMGWGAEDFISPIQVEITNETQDSTLILDVKVFSEEIDFDYPADFNIWEFNMTISNALTVGLDLQNTYGDINIESQNTTFSQIKAQQKTGSFNLDDYGSTMLENMDINTDTGSIRIYAEESSMPGISATSKTGRIKLDISQNSNIGNCSLITDTGSIDYTAYNSWVGETIISVQTGSIDVEVKSSFIPSLDAESNTGSIDVYFRDWFYFNPLNINLETNTGSIEVEGVEFSDLNATMTIDATTDTGSIDVYVQVPEGNASNVEILTQSDLGSVRSEVDEFSEDV